MPILGQVERIRDLGLGSSYHKMVWHACLDCGVERWVLFRSGVPQSLRCHPCGAKVGAEKRRGQRMGPRASNWRGGRQLLRNGYIMVTLSPADPYAAMGTKTRHRAVYEHRLVMARHLGRLLTTEEQVHHLNGDKTDNRIENLELLSQREHSAKHHAEIRELRKRVKQLEAEVASLTERLREHQAATP